MEKKGRRICIVGPSKRFFSGITVQTIYLANALSKRNEVSALLFRDIVPKFLYPGKEHVGKNLFTVDFGPDVKVCNGLDYYSPFSWYRGYKFLQDVKPEVIIMMWWSAAVAHMELLVKAAARTRLRSKIILEMHEITDPLESSILPIRLYSRIVSRLLVKGLEAYTTPAESSKDIIARTFSIDGGKFFVVPMALYSHYGPALGQAEARERLGIKEDFVIGYFGVIREYKGVSYLIEAFNLLPDNIARNCRLLIVGEIWEGRKELLERIEESKRKAQITLVPRYISDQEVPIYFSAMSVVVLPYLRPVSSGVVQIAKSYGKPIVISEVYGMREYMGDYRETIYVQPEDSAGIAKEILKVYEASPTPQLRQPATQNLDLLAQRYEAIISTLIG